MDKENNTWIKTEFQNTIKISTYLIALVVSDFECVNSHANPPLSKHVNIDMCVRKEALNLTSYSMDFAIKALEHFENYYNIAYPLTKLGKIFKFKIILNLAVIKF